MWKKAIVVVLSLLVICNAVYLYQHFTKDLVPEIKTITTENPTPTSILTPEPLIEEVILEPTEKPSMYPLEIATPEPIEHIQEEVLEVIQEIPEVTEITYTIADFDKNGKGFSLDPLNYPIGSYLEDDYNVIADLSALLNKIVYCMIMRCDAIPYDVQFQEPYLTSIECMYWDEVSIPENRYYFYYAIPLTDGREMSASLFMKTYVLAEGEFSAEYEVRFVEVCFEEYSFSALSSADEIIATNTLTETTGYYSMTDGSYSTETYYPEEGYYEEPDEYYYEEPVITDALALDIRLLEGFGFSPYEEDGTWYCNVGMGKLRYYTGMWVANKSQLRFEPHWQGILSGQMTNNKFLYPTDMYTTDLINFEDYSGKKYTLSRNGLTPKDT